MPQKHKARGTPELLAPAGDRDCLFAAVGAGADAVYCGMGAFNARVQATNFSREDLGRVVAYCHTRGIKVYLALNTLIKNSELERFFEDVTLAYRCGVDAVIVQDPCLAEVIHEYLPDLELHLSTQAAVFNMASAPAGVSRVIMPRELPLERIAAFSRDIATEVFVHGALCVSYSGMCLFSSMVGGRSANRGRCAQPCRKRYNNRYVLSTKDLCLIERLPDLIQAGISSFKIEGRMRDAAYVGTVTRIYRRALERYASGCTELVTEKEKELLYLSFNRGFTQGFAFEDHITDQRMPANRGVYLGKTKDGLIRLRARVAVGDGVAIHSGKKIRGATVQQMSDSKGNPIEEAHPGDVVNLHLEGVADYDAIHKTSKPAPEIEGCALPDLTYPQEIHANGQETRIPYEEVLSTQDRNVGKDEAEGQNSRHTPLLCVYARTAGQAREAEQAGADIVYAEVEDKVFKERKNRMNTPNTASLFMVTPRIMYPEDIDTHIKRIRHLEPDGVYVGNRGLIRELKRLGYPAEKLHLDHAIQCTNDIDVECLHGIPTVSPELSFEQIQEFSSRDITCYVHGRLVLMTMMEPLRAPELVDDEGRHFPIVDHGVYKEILNCLPIGLFSRIRELISEGFRYFFVTPERDTKRIVGFYRKVLDGSIPDDSKLVKGHTLGHFHRGIE